jgi:eukaryotic-like serine/threonine-protein kinase
MVEVYRATDTNVKRAVAAVYGLEGSNATAALMMELLEGPTLADGIARGAIPLDEALPIAKQIAAALDAVLATP